MQTSNPIAALGGCGDVALPLTPPFASNGCDPTIVDVKPGTVERVKRGHIPCMKGDAEPLLARCVAQTPRASTVTAAAQDVQPIVCAIGTPIDQHPKPKVEIFLRLAESLSAGNI